MEARPEPTANSTGHVGRSPLGAGRTTDGLDAETLIKIAYAELHQLAQVYMSRERATHTLTPTALLNEAFLRLADDDKMRFRDVNHFAATAATVMRHILVNHAKAKKAAKRGAGWMATPLDALTAEYDERAGDLEALHEALERLEAIDPIQRRLVDLRFFGGLTMQQAARSLGLSERATYYEWSHARAWLRQQLEHDVEDK